MSRGKLDEVTRGIDQGRATRWLNHAELECWIPFSGMLMSLISALDAQMQRDAKLSLFSYMVLAALSEEPERTMPMSDLAMLTNGSLSRLSHAVAGLERRGWVTRSPAPGNGRITVATLTDAGYEEVVAAAPMHIETVRRLVLDALDDEQLGQLGGASRAILKLVVGPDAPPLRPRTARETELRQ